jgi:hypothetical protein
LPGDQGIHFGAGLSAGQFHEPRAGRRSDRPLSAAPPIERVAAILQGYADRAVFRGFSRGSARQGKAAFQILWHRDRLYHLLLDTRRRTLRFPLLLPDVPPPIYRALQRFLKSRTSAQVPAHRRVDPRKARVVCASRGGNVSLTLTVLRGDYEYGARKLIHLVHEIFLDFLGEHLEYQVEVFDLDPDRP